MAVFSNAGTVPKKKKAPTSAVPGQMLDLTQPQSAPKPAAPTAPKSAPVKAPPPQVAVPPMVTAPPATPPPMEQPGQTGIDASIPQAVNDPNPIKQPPSTTAPKPGSPALEDFDQQEILAGLEAEGKINPLPDVPAAGTGEDAPSDFDQAVADLLEQQVKGAGDVDTAEEEALIKEQMQDQIGAALVDQRAGMGRAGFGASGALAASEGDIQRTARQQGLEDVLGLRRTEEQRALDNALKSIGVDIDVRKQKEDEFFNQELLNTLQSSLGIEGDAPVGGEGEIPEEAKAAIDNALGVVGAETETTKLATAPEGAGFGETGSIQDPIPVSKPPKGGRRDGSMDGKELYSVTEDGRITYYLVG